VCNANATHATSRRVTTRAEKKGQMNQKMEGGYAIGDARVEGEGDEGTGNGRLFFYEKYEK